MHDVPKVCEYTHFSVRSNSCIHSNRYNCIKSIKHSFSHIHKSWVWDRSVYGNLSIHRQFPIKMKMGIKVIAQWHAADGVSRMGTTGKDNSRAILIY